MRAVQSRIGDGSFVGQATHPPAKPNRIELWANLDRIRGVGYRQWLKEIREHYTCPRCRTLNSAYDLKCRQCGEEPSCGYVAQHRSAIELALKNR